MARTRSKKNSPNKNTPNLKVIAKPKKRRTTKRMRQLIAETLQKKDSQNNIKITSSANSLNISKGREIKYTGRKDSLTIEITCNSQNDTNQGSASNKSTKLPNVNNNKSLRAQILKDRTLCEDYETIDCVGIDESDDVILINDCDDSEVIFIDTKPKKDDDSVILIEDDSVMEAASTPEPNHSKTVAPLPIPNNRIAPITPFRPFNFVSSTPLNDNNFNLYDQATEILTCQKKNVQETTTPNLNRFGSNFLNAGSIRIHGLRPIFIDGSNVAIRHSNNKFFSVRGLKICIDYFKLRGHEVTAVVPMYRKNQSQNSDPKLLQELENDGSVIFTPSRRINGRNIVPYDDRYIVLLAHVHKGIIVSSDNFRDLLQENPKLVDTIENRVLNPTWVKDMIIFPSDPLGRHGPKLDEFLRFP